MKLWVVAGALALLATLGAGAALASNAPVQIADNSARCNYTVAGSLERQIRAADRQAPGTSVNALEARQQELNGILQQAQIEDGILQSVCGNRALIAPQDQLYGVIAWAYLLEADIAPKRLTLLHCPQTAATAPEALIASAWFALASTLEDPNLPPGAPSPTPAPLVKEVIPKAQARARAAGITLPAPADTSEYWRDEEVGKTAPCASPKP